MSTSSTPDVKISFSKLDIAVAKVIVKRLVKNGWRKGPKDLLILSDSAEEQWYNEEALVYLQEQKELYYKPIAEIF